MSLLFLDDGNQSELIVAPTISQATLASIEADYKWARFNEYDNRMWAYMYALQDPVLKNDRAKRLKTLWLKLTRPQKVFYAFLTFSGQTDNGGVWQFLFNYPELSVAAFEAFHEIKTEPLAADYRRTLEEMLGKAKSIAALRRKAIQQGPTAKKWAAFVEGYDHLQSPKVIEDYFFAKKFKKLLYQDMCNYIERKIDLFAKVEA